MRPYHQLTREQRYQISALMKMRHSQIEIAETLHVHPSTVSREVKRNRGGRGYRPKQAQRLAQVRHPKGHIRTSPATWYLVDDLLKQDWSPEQISARLKQEQAVRLSPEWIYQHVYADHCAGGELYQHLRSQKKYRKRLGKNDRRGKIPFCTSIEERPKAIEERKRLGDWEIDTVFGTKHAPVLLTLTERKSRFSLLGKLPEYTAKATTKETVRLLSPLPSEKVHSLTSDHGKEFADHQQIAQSLHLKYYFAHPYSAWERGTNENTNGLLRQYFPKKQDLQKVTNEAIQQAMFKLNFRPRKCLAFKTPFEVFFNISVALTT
jgi:transposase, IS30 family